MKKYVLGIFAIALAIGFSAFTKINDQKQHSYVRNGKVFTDVWYQYTGADQSVAERKKKTNYTNPTTTTPSCNSGSNECYVQITGVSGAFPSDITSFDVSFNATTGLPLIQDDVIDNRLQP